MKIKLKMSTPIIVQPSEKYDGSLILQVKKKEQISLIVRNSENIIEKILYFKKFNYISGSNTKFHQEGPNELILSNDIVISSNQAWYKLPVKLNLSKYRISRNGQIMNRFGRISTSKPRKDGYIQFSMIDDDHKKRIFRANRLVAITFIPNPENKKYVDHINHKPYDNRVTNLRWATSQENNLNKIKSKGRPGGRRQVIQKNIDGTIVNMWTSLTDAAKNTGINIGRLSETCRKGVILRGFYWGYYIEQIQGEVWRELSLGNTIIGVSSAGRIKFDKGRVTFGCKNLSGYHKVKVKGKEYSVHRLVCMAFYPNSNYSNLQVNHIDLNKSNNKTSNLEWCTSAENKQHEIRTSDRDYRESGGCRPVKQISLTGQIIGEFPSMAEAGRKLGIQRSDICKVCRGVSKSAGGYRWKYC